MATVSQLHQSSLAGSPRSKAAIPVKRVFQLLGIDARDLGNETVSVSSAGLRLLLSELARQQPFDAEFYADTYPDIEAARLAGVLSDLQEHFVKAGFLEGRLPFEPPFDPVWYAQYYPDVASVIPAHDAAGLRNHFLSSGLAEGRSGTAASLAAAPGWLTD